MVEGMREPVLIAVVALLVSAPRVNALCYGDLNDDGLVAVDEILVLVDRALDPSKNPTSAPTAFTPTRVPTRSVRPTRTPISLPDGSTARLRARPSTKTSRVTTAYAQSALRPASALEREGSGRVTGVDDLVVGLNNALFGCPPLQCEPGSVFDSWGHFEVKETIVGTNGAFTDECHDGSLVERRCELERDCSRVYNPNPREDCTWFETGLVVSSIFVCHGGCVNGTCLKRCPTPADTVVYLELSEQTATFENETDGRLYDCMLVDDSGEGFNCSLDPIVGDRERVSHFQLAGRLVYCTEDMFGYVTLENGCRYHCGIKEDSDLDELGG